MDSQPQQLRRSFEVLRRDVNYLELYDHSQDHIFRERFNALSADTERFHRDLTKKGGTILKKTAMDFGLRLSTVIVDAIVTVSEVDEFWEKVETFRLTVRSLPRAVLTERLTFLLDVADLEVGQIKEENHTDLSTGLSIGVSSNEALAMFDNFVEGITILSMILRHHALYDSEHATDDDISFLGEAMNTFQRKFKAIEEEVNRKTEVFSYIKIPVFEALKLTMEERIREAWRE